MLDLKAAVASDRQVQPCADLPDPRFDPAAYHFFAWDMCCGSAPITEQIVNRAAARGVKVGRVGLDIDPRRRATLCENFLTFDYKELYRVCPCAYAHFTLTCTSLAGPSRRGSQRRRLRRTVRPFVWLRRRRAATHRGAGRGDAAGDDDGRGDAASGSRRRRERIVATPRGDLARG